MVSDCKVRLSTYVVSLVVPATVELPVAVVDVTVDDEDETPEQTGAVQATLALAGATYVCVASTPGCLTT